jgi:hypothetical protein
VQRRTVQPNAWGRAARSPSAGRNRACLAPAPWLAEDGPVLLMLALGFAPTLMWITLALAIYLTVIELRELRPHFLWWFWWILLVVMTHFVGYVILRGYAFRRRRLARTQAR